MNTLPPRNPTDAAAGDDPVSPAAATGQATRPAVVAVSGDLVFDDVVSGAFDAELCKRRRQQRVHRLAPVIEHEPAVLPRKTRNVVMPEPVALVNYTFGKVNENAEVRQRQTKHY